MKKQFAGLLYDTGFISSSYPKEESANVNSKNLKLVKAVLCAGLYPNVIKIEQNRPGRCGIPMYILLVNDCGVF